MNINITPLFLSVRLPDSINRVYPPFNQIFFFHKSKFQIPTYQRQMLQRSDRGNIGWFVIFAEQIIGMAIQ